MVEGKNRQFHYNYFETTISPKIIEKRTKREREQERGNKRLEKVFCLFIYCGREETDSPYSQELPQSCMIFKIQSDIQV